MNLKQKILNNDKQTAPDCSGSPEVMKVIFSRHSKATAGSSCNGFRKKTLRTRAIAQSWNRLKKNKVIAKIHCTDHEYAFYKEILEKTGYKHSFSNYNTLKHGHRKSVCKTRFKRKRYTYKCSQ